MADGSLDAPDTGEPTAESPWWRRRRWAVAAAVVAVAAAAWLLRPGGEAQEVAFRLAEVERGSIVESVSSTGRLSALGEITLTSQVAGQVLDVPADFNDAVSMGQVLARLDPETFEAQLVQAEADLAIAKADLVSSRASVERAQADVRNGAASIESLEAQLQNSRIGLDAASRDLQRQRDLFAQNIVTAVAVDEAVTRFDQAQAQFDQIRAQLEGQLATLDSRRASLAMSEAGVVTAEARVQQREAQVNAAIIELSHTEIRSPVDGTVIARSVEPGQTIANVSATPLFTIAQDLRQMLVEVSVDEADIGNIRDGQRVLFSVDAYPTREYGGTVRQVRYAAETIQNVVTYTVIVGARNADLSLLPGMTATARIILDERDDALRVPNAALRYVPVGFTEAAAAEGRPAPAAVDAGPPANAGGPPAAGRPQGGGGRAGLAQFEALDLTDDQRQRINEAVAQARGGRGGGAAGGGANVRTAIFAVLTPEQRAALEAGGAAGAPAARSGGGPRAARVFVLDEDGSPRPVSIRIGLTDGGYTELVAGELDAGAQVVVGSNEAEAAEPPNSRPRFFGF